MRTCFSLAVVGALAIACGGQVVGLGETPAGLKKGERCSECAGVYTEEAKACPGGIAVGRSCLSRGDGTCAYDFPECTTAASDAGPAGCTKAECGALPGAPTVLCPDGVNYQGAGPCARNASGVCRYGILSCPDAGGGGMDAGPAGCTKAECGALPGVPTVLCPDGVNYQGAGPCARNASGVCRYVILSCPDAGGGGMDAAPFIDAGSGALDGGKAPGP
jgi:hypothetical protein